MMHPAVWCLESRPTWCHSFCHNKYSVSLCTYIIICTGSIGSRVGFIYLNLNWRRAGNQVDMKGCFDLAVWEMRVYVYRSILIEVHQKIHIHVIIYICTCTLCIHVHVYIHIYMYVYIYTCMYIHTYNYYMYM